MSVVKMDHSSEPEASLAPESIATGGEEDALPADSGVELGKAVKVLVIVQGIVETQGEETEVSDEEAERDLEAAEVGFATMSEEEYAALQTDDE